LRIDFAEVNYRTQLKGKFGVSLICFQNFVYISSKELFNIGSISLRGIEPAYPKIKFNAIAKKHYDHKKDNGSQGAELRIISSS